MEAVHYSVLKSEVLSYLKPTRAGELFIDCTTGEGGHSEALLSAYPDIKLICLDADDNVLITKEVKDVPLARNKKTTLSGALFTPTAVAIGVRVEEDWLPEETITF